MYLLCDQQRLPKSVWTFPGISIAGEVEGARTLKIYMDKTMGILRTSAIFKASRTLVAPIFNAFLDLSQAHATTKRHVSDSKQPASPGGRLITFLPLFRKQLITTTTTYSCFLRVELERDGGVWRSVDYGECNTSTLRCLIAGWIGIGGGWNCSQDLISGVGVGINGWGEISLTNFVRKLLKCV